MASQFLVHSRAVFSVWGEPTIADIDRAEAEIAEAAAHSGGPVAYIARVPADAPAPDAAVRQHLERRLPSILSSCASYHAVLEGSGFVAALKRGVFASLWQLSWRRATFFVHARVDEVADHVEAAHRPDVIAVLELARRRGLLDSAGAP